LIFHVLLLLLLFTLFKANYSRVTAGLAGFHKREGLQGWVFAMANSIFARTVKKTVTIGNNWQKV